MNFFSHCLNTKFGCGAGRVSLLIPKIKKIKRQLILHGLVGSITAGIIVGLCTTGDDPKVVLRGDLGDHVSHSMAAVLFMHEGLNIYRQPIHNFCDNSSHSPHEIDLLVRQWHWWPHLLCWPKGHWFGRVLAINFPQFPRFYPPGHLLYFMPEAFMYRWGGASFKVINQISIIKLTLIAHLCWIIAALLLIDFAPRGIAWIILFIVYSNQILWAINGQYDGIGILGILLMLLSLKRGQMLAALFWLSFALFLHFRALWYVYFFPIIGYGLWLKKDQLQFPSLKSGLSFSRSIKPLMMVLLSGMMLILSAWSFIKVWPYFKEVSLNNPLHRDLAGSFNLKKWLAFENVMGYFLVTGAIGFLFAFRKNWMALVSLLWITLFLVKTPLVRPWYAGFLLPTLLQPTLTRDYVKRMEQAVGTLVWFLAAIHFAIQTNIWPGWIARLVARLLINSP